MNDVQKDKLQQTLNRQYNFNVKQILSNAASLTKSNYGALLQGSVVLFLTFVVIGLLAQPYITVNNDGTYVFEHQSIIEIIAICIVSPLITGLYMMGVMNARAQKTSVFTVFSFFPLLFLLALTQLVNSILVQLGLVLLIIPGLYFYLASSFSLMLVADRKLTPISAIILSCRVFNAYWTQIAAVYGVLFLLFLTAPLTLGFSLIWVLPFYFSVMGLLYQELIGEQERGKGAPINDVNESRFDA